MKLKRYVHNLVKGWLPETPSKNRIRQIGFIKIFLLTTSVIISSIFMMNLYQFLLMKPYISLNNEPTEPPYPYVSGLVAEVPCNILELNYTHRPNQHPSNIHFPHTVICTNWFTEDDINKSVIGISDSLAESLNITNCNSIGKYLPIVVDNFTTECSIIFNFKTRMMNLIVVGEYDAVIHTGIIPENVTRYDAEIYVESLDPKEDYDRDSLSNEIEANIGSDPTNWDTDRDGIGDGLEYILNVTMSATAAPIPQIALMLGAIVTLTFYIWKKKRN